LTAHIYETFWGELFLLALKNREAFWVRLSILTTAILHKANSGVQNIRGMHDLTHFWTRSLPDENVWLSCE
jgi:hypothetical protein